MTILDEIIIQKKEEVALLKKDFTSRNSVFEGPSFFESLKDNQGLKIIAEIKRSSPSAGLIQRNFEPVTIAEKYAAGGANALSILTDKKFFGGHLSFLKEIRQSCSLPILRKDFIIDPVQIEESVDSGAGAILLIVAILDDRQLKDLDDIAKEKNLDVLVEVHDRQELERALAIDPKIIGINNRDLNTFTVDLGTTENLISEISPGVLVVCESGIKETTHIERIAGFGVHCVLVGETLMREKNPGIVMGQWKEAYKKVKK